MHMSQEKGKYLFHIRYIISVSRWKNLIDLKDIINSLKDSFKFYTATVIVMDILMLTLSEFRSEIKQDVVALSQITDLVVIYIT